MKGDAGSMRVAPQDSCSQARRKWVLPTFQVPFFCCKSFIWIYFPKKCYNFLKYEAFQRNKIHELLKCIIQVISKIEQLILLDYKGLLEASPFCLS